VVYHYALQGYLMAETSGSGSGGRLRTYVWRDGVPMSLIV
jgi:hypothetical protein